MMAIWMLAATAFGLLAGATALALERALRLMGRQGRGAWVLALVVTCAWPVAAPALRRPLVQSAQVRVTTPGAVTALSGADPAVMDSPGVRTRLARLDVPLVVLWGAASVLLLFRAVVAVRSLRRLAQGAEPCTVDGHSVLITPSVGPAAFGIVRPRIVLPRWSLELDASMRELVMRHEVEHVASADPAVLTFAWLLAALMPWNLGLWWIVRRLRTATELDCDCRVVRRGADTRRYAHLLMLIAQRQVQATFASMIAGSPSTLLERIAAMHTTPPARPVRRAAALLLVALVAGGVAASPALARELASVRELVAGSTPSQDQAAIRQSVVQAQHPLMLPVVNTVAVRKETPARQRPTTTAPTQEPAPALVQDTTKKPVEAYIEFKIDSQVQFARGSSIPRYPEILKSAGVSGVTVVQFVVDTTGLPIPGTLKVVRSAHQLFTEAVRTSLPDARFVPARVGTRHVKQLVQVVYKFVVDGIPMTDTTAVTSAVRTLELTITARAPR